MRGAVREPDDAAARVLRQAAVPESQRRRGDLRARRDALHRARRRRSRGRSARQRPEPDAHRSPRSCASTRLRPATPRTACPPTTRSSEPQGRLRRDLDVRPAQSVAVLVRPRDRRHVDRRRRAERVRRDRLRAAWTGRASTGVGTAREGFHSFTGSTAAPGARDPIVETSHSDGYCAIVGGYVYRGRAIPSLRGVYVYGDDCKPDIEALVQRNGRAIAKRRPRDPGRRAHELRRGRNRRALRRRPRRHHLQVRRRMITGRRAFDDRGGEPPGDRVGRDVRKRSEHLVHGRPGSRPPRFFASASRPQRATTSASCHMKPGNVGRRHVRHGLEAGARESGTQHGDRHAGALELFVHGLGERRHERLASRRRPRSRARAGIRRATTH